jgi:anti-sigma B factor antagonist
MMVTLEEPTRPVAEPPAATGLRNWSWNGVAVISAPHEIDISNSRQLRSALLAIAAEARIVIADMSETSFCDSTALSALAAVSRTLAASGGELRVVNANIRTYRCMRATGDDRRLRIFASLSEALAVPHARQSRWRWVAAGTRRLPGETCLSITKAAARRRDLAAQYLRTKAPSNT